VATSLIRVHSGTRHNQGVKTDRKGQSTAAKLENRV
jgi:hypothetical protein